jgi:tripartite-type tricarboxylate transporter receptor subunit TctC
MIVGRHVANVVVGILGLSVMGASGQGFPTRSILIRSTTPGGTNDLAARIVAKEIAGPLGQPVVVENVPSAIAGENLARAKPDGYTMALGAGTIWLTPLFQKTPYTMKDLAPISSVMTYPHVLVVHPSVPAKSVGDLIKLAKSRPGELNIAGSASPGSQSRMGAELFKSMAGVNIVHIPFKGNPEGLRALVSGEVQAMFTDTGSAMPLVKAGKLKALAVTSLKPFSYAPGVPTVTASGLPGFESILFAGILAPGGTPAAIISRLNQEIVRALSKPDVPAQFPKLGIDAEVVPSSPEQFAAKIDSEMVKWGKIFKDAGLNEN